MQNKTLIDKLIKDHKLGENSEFLLDSIAWQFSGDGEYNEYNLELVCKIASRYSNPSEALKLIDGGIPQSKDFRVQDLEDLNKEEEKIFRKDTLSLGGLSTRIDEYFKKEKSRGVQAVSSKYSSDYSDITYHGD